MKKTFYAGPSLRVEVTDKVLPGEEVVVLNFGRAYCDVLAFSDDEVRRLIEALELALVSKAAFLGLPA